MSHSEPSPQWVEMQRRYPESAIHAALGLSLRVLGPGEVIVDYDGRPEAGNRTKNAAGGALAEMIDSAVVQAAGTLLTPGDLATTLELKVNYLRAAPVGQHLATRASIQHIGRTTAVGLARVEDEAGNTVAIGLVSVSLRRHSSQKGRDQ